MRARVLKTDILGRRLNRQKTEHQLKKKKRKETREKQTAAYAI